MKSKFNLIYESLLNSNNLTNNTLSVGQWFIEKIKKSKKLNTNAQNTDDAIKEIFEKIVKGDLPMIDADYGIPWDFNNLTSENMYKIVNKFMHQYKYKTLTLVFNYLIEHQQEMKNIKYIDFKMCYNNGEIYNPVNFQIKNGQNYAQKWINFMYKSASSYGDYPSIFFRIQQLNNEYLKISCW